jgi:hypothetical protein
MLVDKDGNAYWKPTLKQERFLQIPLSIKEGFYAGAVNAGKTDVLLMYPIVHGWHKHPLFKGVFLRRTMPELRMEVIPRAEEYFRPLGAKYNKTDAVWTFPSGALLFMNHCEHEKDVHNYDSMQINYLAFDELTSFTEWMYTYLTIERVRVNKNLEHELPAIVRSGSNPGNIGHRFVFDRFIKPYKEGGKVIVGRGGVKRIYIPATIDDNPHASEQYKRELDALPEAERKAKKGGDWTAYEGQVFSEFRDKKIPSEPENAIHVVDPFEIPAYWPKIVAIDWGYEALNSTGFGAISPTKRVYVYRHLVHHQKKISEWGPEVRYWIEKENPQDLVICHSASQNRGDPHTIQQQVQDELNAIVRLGEKDRLAGKTLIHEYLRWREKPKVPVSELKPFDLELAQKILRNHGTRAYNQYIAQYLPPEPEVNIPKLQLFNDPNVLLIVDALKDCVYEKADKDGKKKEDVAEFPGDDPYDMLRMLLHAADSFFELAETEQHKLEEVQKIVDKFKVTGDNTTYYRQMRSLEAREREVAVSRFNNRRGYYGRH